MDWTYHKQRHPRYILSSQHSPSFNSKQNRRNDTISPIHRDPQLLPFHHPFFPLSLQPSFPDIERSERAEGEGVPGCSYWNRVHWPTLPQPARDQASANATHPFLPLSFFFLLLSLLRSRHLFSSPRVPRTFFRLVFRLCQTPLFKRKDRSFFPPTSLTPCCLPEEML